MSVFSPIFFSFSSYSAFYLSAAEFYKIKSLSNGAGSTGTSITGLPTGIPRDPNLRVISSLTSSSVAVGSWNQAEYLN